MSYALNFDLIKNHLVNHLGWSPAEAKKMLHDNPDITRDVTRAKISIVEACDILNTKIGA